MGLKLDIGTAMPKQRFHLLNFANKCMSWAFRESLENVLVYSLHCLIGFM